MGDFLSGLSIVLERYHTEFYRTFEYSGVVSGASIPKVAPLPMSRIQVELLGLVVIYSRAYGYMWGMVGLANTTVMLYITRVCTRSNYIKPIRTENQYHKQVPIESGLLTDANRWIHNSFDYPQV